MDQSAATAPWYQKQPLLEVLWPPQSRKKPQGRPETPRGITFPFDLRTCCGLSERATESC